MMIRTFVIALSTLFIATGAQAMEPLFQFEHPYAFATSEVQKNGAVFMSIRNNQTEALKIVGAESEVAERIELHTHTMDGDMMMMREVEAFEVGPEGAEHMLKPMGDHIMLMSLKKQLVEGDQFSLTLKTEDGRSLPVNVEVVAPGTNPTETTPLDQGHHDHSHHHHGHTH